MKALTYIEYGEFAFMDKPKLKVPEPRDAVARVKSISPADYPPP